MPIPSDSLEQPEQAGTHATAEQLIEAAKQNVIPKWFSDSEITVVRWLQSAALINAETTNTES
jgi:hypothetical protein